MRPGPLLGDVLRLGDDPHLKKWGAGVLDVEPVAALGDISGAVYDLACAHLGAGPRIHPTAYVSPLANVHEDVVIGPGARIYEYATVRGRSVVSGDVHIGYGCEISRSVLAQGAVLSHRATIACSVIGQHAYFATGLVIAVCTLSNPDMLRPTRPVDFAGPDGRMDQHRRAQMGRHHRRPCPRRPARRPGTRRDRRQPAPSCTATSRCPRHGYRRAAPFGRPIPDTCSPPEPTKESPCDVRDRTPAPGARTGEPPQVGRPQPHAAARYQCACRTATS